MPLDHLRSKQATDVVTFLGERVIGEDELGNELTEDDVAIATVPCRLEDGGTGFVREVTGERVREAPKLVCPPLGWSGGYGANYGSDYGDQTSVSIADVVSEGMDAVLADRDERFGVMNVSEVFDLLGQIDSVTVEVER